MGKMPADSVDVLLCDPPYGLEFMGKEWDRIGDIGKMSNPGISDEPGFKGFRLPSHQASANVKCRKCGRWRWDHEGRRCDCDVPELPNLRAVQAMIMQRWHEDWLREAFRVLVPGGMAHVFSGTRTYHRLAMAMEIVGFEGIRIEAWNYASGFPKSLDVSKAIDKMFGAERKVVGYQDRLQCPNGIVDAGRGLSRPFRRYITEATTDEAKAWDGWGTALKPSWEPFLVGVKP
jgi:DNA modification methylase